MPLKIRKTPIVEATATGPTTVELRWLSIPDATEYAIYRGGQLIDSHSSTGHPVTELYQAGGLTASTQYSFQVAAVINGREGRKSSAVSATTQAAPSPTGTIMAGEDFENATQFPIGYQWPTTQRSLTYGSGARALASAENERPTIVSSPTLDGSRASIRCQLIGADPDVRSEMSFRNFADDGVSNWEGKRHYIGFGMYLPSDWPLTNQGYGVLGMQMHNIVSGGVSYPDNQDWSPVWGLRIEYSRSATHILLTGVFNGTNNTYPGSPVSLRVPIVPITDCTGRWTRWVFDILFSESAGYCRVYFAQDTNALALVHTQGPHRTFPGPATGSLAKLGYYKFGLYNNSDPPDTHIMYLDNIKIVGSDGSVDRADPLSGYAGAVVNF